MNDTALPSRLKQSTFTRFEPVIAMIVRHYPKDVPLHPPYGISVDVFAARLRDAMLSLCRYDWPSSLIDKNKFHTHHKDIGVLHRQDGTIYAGSKKQSRMVLNFDEVAAVPVTKGIVLTATTREQKEYLCYIVVAGIRPLIVRGITPEEAVEFEALYDVLIRPEPNGTMSIV